MEYLNNGLTYLLDKPYGWVILVALGLVIVAVTGYGVGLYQVKKYIRLSSHNSHILCIEVHLLRL